MLNNSHGVYTLTTRKKKGSKKKDNKKKGNKKKGNKKKSNKKKGNHKDARDHFRPLLATLDSSTPHAS